MHLIDEKLRREKEAQRIFIDLLLKHGNPESLRRMNELGALAAFIPEFEPIVAMMQFNMYHSYTVDEHTIHASRAFPRLNAVSWSKSYLSPAQSLRKVWQARYTALLVHDIGKGQKRITLCRVQKSVGQWPRLGLDQDEADTVEWLVRYHLLMSDMAQKRDIADPRTVRDFAKGYKIPKDRFADSPNRLRYSRRRAKQLEQLKAVRSEHFIVKQRALEKD